jgi:hypothetical protein
MDLAVSPLAGLSLRTSVKSCSAIQGGIHLLSFQKLVGAPPGVRHVLTIRIHFGLSLTDAGVHHARRATAVSNPRVSSMTVSTSGCCCVVKLTFRVRVTLRLAVYRHSWSQAP